MTAGRNLEPSPGQLPLEGEDFQNIPLEQRFNPKDRKAFGSIPGLLSRGMSIPAFEQLDGAGLARVAPQSIEANLYGVQDGTSVNGLLLNPKEYNVFVRSDTAFGRAIQSTTMAANKHTTQPERYRREARSAEAGFTNKIDKYDGVLKGLADEQQRLETLLRWQRAPGYARTDKLNIVVQANDAWSGTFANIVTTLADYHHLSKADAAKTNEALEYRLFRGAQSEKIAYWGDMLKLSLRYNKAKTTMFTQSQRRIITLAGGLAVRAQGFDAHQ